VANRKNKRRGMRSKGDRFWNPTLAVLMWGRGRLGKTSRLAGEWWDDDGGDGIDRSVLDSCFRDSGTSRIKAAVGGCPAHEKCSGPTDRLAGVPVAAIPACGIED